MTKNSVIALFIAFGLVLIAFAGGVKLGRTQGADEVLSHVYPKSGIVTEINRIENAITIEDFTGNTWVWEGIEDWQEGDIASMIMDDNGTDIITDDTILDIHYEGWTEG